MNTRTLQLVLISILLSCNLMAKSIHRQVISKALIIRDITGAAEQVGVRSDVLIALCFVESSLRPVAPRVDGSTPSYGVCQMKLATARHIDKVYKHRKIATPARLNIPYINAFYAAKYLTILLKQYHGNLEAALDSYNKGHYVSSDSQYVRRVKKAIQTQGKAAVGR